MSASVTYTATIQTPTEAATKTVTLEMYAGITFVQVTGKFQAHLDSWYPQGSEILEIRVTEPAEITPRNRRKANSMLDVQKQLAGMVQDVRDLEASVRKAGPYDGMTHEWELDLSSYRSIVSEMRNVQKRVSDFMGD